MAHNFDDVVEQYKNAGFDATTSELLSVQLFAGHSGPADRLNVMILHSEGCRINRFSSYEKHIKIAQPSSTTRKGLLGITDNPPSINTDNGIMFQNNTIYVPNSSNLSKQQRHAFTDLLMDVYSFNIKNQSTQEVPSSQLTFFKLINVKDKSIDEYLSFNNMSLKFDLVCICDCKNSTPSPFQITKDITINTETHIEIPNESKEYLTEKGQNLHNYLDDGTTFSRINKSDILYTLLKISKAYTRAEQKQVTTTDQIDRAIGLISDVVKSIDVFKNPDETQEISEMELLSTVYDRHGHLMKNVYHTIENQQERYENGVPKEVITKEVCNNNYDETDVTFALKKHKKLRDIYEPTDEKYLIL